jgi:hypothetical protein
LNNHLNTLLIVANQGFVKVLEIFFFFVHQTK